jgi:hypothetical protein
MLTVWEGLSTIGWRKLRSENEDLILNTTIYRLKIGDFESLVMDLENQLEVGHYWTLRVDGPVVKVDDLIANISCKC